MKKTKLLLGVLLSVFGVVAMIGTVNATTPTVGQSTTIINGGDFNSELKRLAGTNADANAINNNIKHFERTGVIPDGVTTGLLSNTNSELPIYAWFDDTNGTIYYYTEADKIYTPESMWYMFNGFSVLEELDLSEWDTSRTTSMRTVFQYCYKLKRINMSGWNTSEVTDMSYMFNSCESLTHLDLSSFNTSKVTSMRTMFSECHELEELDLSNFDTSNVTDMKSMFMGVTTGMKLKSLNISSFNTKNVTNMRAMFQKCSSLTGLDLRNFDTSNVNDMAYMFTSCRSLEHLDVSSFDTSNVTTMTVMFGECLNLVELDVGDFDTTNVTDMSYMFYGLKKLQSLDVSNFHTTNVTNMFGMFAVCSELTELDLSKWDTNKVKNISNMFYGSVNLETVYASENFNTSNVTADESIFLGNKFLVGGNGTVYDEERLNKEYAKIDILGQTGYFTDPNEITVNFISEGELYTGKIVVKSGQVERPSENPSKTGLVFTNWYEDSGLNTVFDFNKGIMKYTELYAGFGVEPQDASAHINLSVIKGALTIGTETGNLNLGEVNVSNNAQELSGSFGRNSFWVEDMKGLETGYYTTISVTNLTGTVATHVISANNVYLKTAGNEPSYISGAIVSDSKVVFSNDIKLWHNNWAEPVTYFNRQNTATADAGRVGKWGDNLQIKVNIPAHTPYDTYRGTITYTLYDLDS